MLLIIVSGPCISATLCPLHSLPAVDCALPADLAAAKAGQLNFGAFAYSSIGGNTTWNPVKPTKLDKIKILYCYFHPDTVISLLPSSTVNPAERRAVSQSSS